MGKKSNRKEVWQGALVHTHTHLLLELDDGGGVDLVHEPAENDPVLQYLGVVSLRHRLVQHSRDPLTERIRTGFDHLFKNFCKISFEKWRSDMNRG
jgi:hypothetical protein